MAANPATLQQQAGLHPFVTDMKIVNPMMYPTIENINVNTKEWCQPVITNDFNMYTIVTEPVTLEGQNHQTSQARLVKFQRQNFHENYFVATTASLPGGSEVIIQTDAVYIDTTYFNPMLTYAVAQNILFILVNREVLNFNGETTSIMVLTAYRVNDGTEGGHDVLQLWQKVWTVKTDMNLYGTMLGEGKIYWYKLDDAVLSIRPIDRITGVEAGIKTITLDQTYSYCKLTMSLFTNTYYITVRAGNIIRMATGLLNDDENTLSAFITVATASGVSLPTAPEVLAFDTEEGKTMCSVIHGYNYDTNNILRVVYIPNIIKDNNISGLETPFYYNLNKFQLFSEVQDQNQSDVSVSVTCNPNNADFSYIAYVATTSQIRIVKLYRNKVANTYETHVPLVMWGTRLGVIKDTVNGKVGVNVDTNGNVYVFTWSDNGNIHISKIREYIMDLGHTEGTVIAPINTITDMLSDMTNEYTILTPRQGFLYSAFPNINEVTIDTVVNDDGLKLDIKFNYLNYTYLQGFPDIVSGIRNLITTTFRTLYDDSSITVLNLDSNAIGLEGDAYSLNVYLPIGTSKKPCVVKGTEIIRRTHDKAKAELIAVEHIRVGDMVLNHEGNYVKVLDHLCSTIYAQEHNAPFLVPRGFFGVNRPYKDLLISGDHGILVHYQSARNMKVEYAENISVLKRVLLGVTVEFHHLLLESHQDNFYIANGLEVDSYHPVAFMRS